MGDLPPLPLDEWRGAKDTLHLWSQIVGKVRLAHMPPRNESWHVPLYVTPRGLTTSRIPVGEASLEIAFDFVDHRLVATTNDDQGGFDLHDGLSVAAFYEQTMTLLETLGAGTHIKPKPYGVPMTTPFPDDTEHASYDRDAVRRFHTVMTFCDTMLQTFAGWFSGKASPVHVFWHSFDIAHTRFAGDQQIAFGFWPGDDITPAPTFYSYTAPEPEGLRGRPLQPDAATWFVKDGGATAHLAYETARTLDDPRAAVLDFFDSAYRAGAQLAGWDIRALATSWAPDRSTEEGGDD